MVMRLDIRKRDRRGVRLWFPLVPVWLITFALLIAVLPFVAIGALATRRGGPGVGLLLLYPALFGVLFTLSGLRVDVANHDGEKTFISFD